jgi:hypothetical protein
MIEMDNQKDKTQKSTDKQANESSKHEKPEQKKAVDDTKREEVQDNKEYAKRIEEKTEKH